MIMKNKVLTFVCCSFLFSAYLNAQEPLTTDQEKQLDKIGAMVKSDPAAASKELSELLKGKNKKNISLLVAVGNMYLENDKVDEAKTYLNQAMNIDSKSAPVAVLAGDIALANRDAGTACGYYEQAILFDSNCFDAYYKYAHAYIGVNPQLSLDMLLKLKKAHPEEISVDRELANVYYEMKNYSMAKASYDIFMHQGKPEGQAYVRYAMLLYLNKDYDKSLSMVQKGIELNGDNHLLKRLKMYNLYELKSYQEAIEAAADFFANKESHDYVYLDYLYRGRLYLAYKESDKALEQYQKALELDTDKEYPEVMKEVSDVYSDLKNYPEAIRLYKLYLDVLDSKAKVSDLFLLGRLYYMAACDPEYADNKVIYLTKADEIFAEVSQKIPDNYLGYFWRARTCTISDPETVEGLAKPYYEKALNILEEKGGSSNSLIIECESYLGYYYFVKKDYEQSKLYWNKILELDPENQTARQALEGLK